MSKFLSVRRVLRVLKHFGVTMLALVTWSVPTTPPASAAASLSITPITWNVIGLKSNNVNVGPDTFPVGARVCNTGDSTATDVTADFDFTSNVNDPFITTTGLTTTSLGDIGAGSCEDAYFSVVITRHTDSFDKTRPYQISASATGLGTVSTPLGREIYVEHLIEQSRNSTDSITGPTLVEVGGTYQYTLVASTAPGGYEQLEAFVDFPNVVFQILSVDTSYGTGGTSDLLYSDACGWDNDPLSAGYLSCGGTGKEGGGVTTVYTVKILSAGTATVTALIYDFSGSSFHYNQDYGLDVLTIQAVEPTPTTTTTTAPPTTTTTTTTPPTTTTTTPPAGTRFEGTGASGSQSSSAAENTGAPSTSTPALAFTGSDTRKLLATALFLVVFGRVLIIGAARKMGPAVRGHDQCP